MKPITKVFLVVGLLVLIFLVWALFFNDNGILQTGYNAGVGVVNDTWETVTGSSGGILPEWDDTGVNSDGENLDGVNGDF